MAWYTATQRETSELLSFLRTREWSCVSFTSRLINREGGGNRIFINRESDERIVESVLLTGHGLVLPVIDPERSSGELFRTQLSPLFGGSARFIHSVMGIESQVRLIDGLLSNPIYEHIDYYLMTREYFNIERPQTEVGGLRLRKATPSDARSLFPLQREYEKEEVLLDPTRFNPTASFLSLQKSLRREIVYLAELDGEPIAKAATNARGINYYQLGGIYTIPSLRGRGIARTLIQALMWEIAQKKKHLSLFVKKQNAAAIKVYTNLGFSLRDSYAISYYRS